MIVAKIAILFFFLLSCPTYLTTNEESKQVIILNDEITTITSPVHCIADTYFIFRNELYKICIQHVNKGRTEIHVIVQKKAKNKWETKQKLFEDKMWFHLPFVFNFVQNDEIIILVCRYKGMTKGEGVACDRWSSTTGTNYNKGNINIDAQALTKMNLDSYASFPIPIKDKAIIHICGVHSYEYQNVNQNNFISCLASEDKGTTWGDIKIHIYYDQFQEGVPYFYLRPLVFNDEFGFYLYSRISSNNADRGGKYMKCILNPTNSRNKEYTFKCTNVNLIKEDKSLQNITKLNGYYVTSYAKKNNFNECYLYYTENNAIVVKPKVQNYELNGCYGGSFVKFNESKALFIYSTGHGVQNIHTLHYARYE